MEIMLSIKNECWTFTLQTIGVWSHGTKYKMLFSDKIPRVTNLGIKSYTDKILGIKSNGQKFVNR